MVQTPPGAGHSSASGPVSGAAPAQPLIGQPLTALIGLIGTKVCVPPRRPGSIPRPRLAELLRRVPSSRLTLVSAPAGFGKTTVLADWLADWPAAQDPAEGQARTAWLSLDAGDNDPVRFLRYLIAALRTIFPTLGASAASLLAGPQPPPVRSVIASLIGDLVQAPSGPAGQSTGPVTQPADLVLVLDDYHVITAPAVHEAITLLLDHGPPNMHLVIATRADPPLPVARLRSRGELLELRAADLRFTPEEAAAFLAGGSGPVLSPEQVAALEARTEGWISGLVLAAISLRGQPDVQGFIDSFTGSHRHVLDYLVSEVLASQPQEVQAFLEQTSVAERLCGPLCDALTGRTDGQAMLERLEAANLFVVPLDPERRWYRYHHLFGDLLQTRLRRAHPDLVPVLRARASAWCEANGDMDQAIEQALAGEDWERAGRLLERNAQHYIGYGRLGAVLRWIKVLPEQAVRGRPGLCLEVSLADVYAGRVREAEPLLRHVELALASGEVPEADTARIRRGFALQKAFIAVFDGDPARALELLHGAAEPSEDHPWYSFNYYWLAGYALRFCGRLPEAMACYTEALRAGRALGNPLAIAMPLTDLAVASRLVGKLHRAAAHYREVLRSAAEWGMVDAPYVISAEAGLAAALLEQNLTGEALTLAKEAARKAPALQLADHVPVTQVALARVLMATQDWPGAAEALHLAREALRRAPAMQAVEATVDSAQVRLWLAQGDLAAAGRWAAEFRAEVGSEAADGQLDEATELRLLALARVLLAQAAAMRTGEAGGRTLDEAGVFLERLRRSAEQSGRMNSLLEVLVLQALAQARKAAARRSEVARTADLNAALSTLERCLELAQPEGYTRLFLDEGAPMARLLTEFVARRVAAGAAAGGEAKVGAAADAAASYAAHLLTAFPPGAASRGEVGGVGGMGGAGSALPEPLTEREADVLRLLAAGLPNKGIAERLFVSEGTVKTHMHNLLRKLEAKGRTQALIRARELGLI